MGREEQDRRIVVEGMLGAVTVVEIPVHDQDLFQSVLFFRICGGDGDVIENAEAHAAIRFSMVSGRPDKGENSRQGPGPGSRVRSESTPSSRPPAASRAIS